MSPWTSAGQSSVGTPFSSMSLGTAKRLNTLAMTSMMAPSDTAKTLVVLEASANDPAVALLRVETVSFGQEMLDASGLRSEDFADWPIPAGEGNARSGRATNAGVIDPLSIRAHRHVRTEVREVEESAGFPSAST